jgi:ribonucleoside-diphosphate reductase alpha chain
MEVIAYHTILASSLLAKERGTYESYKGSKWDRGILPQDTLALLEQERGMKIDVPRHETLDWRLVREAVRQWGMRNSNTMANAPTASTANIAGCYPTIEPIYKNLYVKSNMAGDFMVVNEFLVEDLKRLGLWNMDMLEKIKFFDGSVQEIEEIPPALRAKYKEVFEIEPQWLVKAAAYRGRWIDQSQSLNIFYGGTSGRVLSEIYQYAWGLGLKTTYYLRTLGASRIEKSTVNLAKFGGTSKADSSVASSGTATVTVEEKVTITASVPSPVIMGGQQMAFSAGNAGLNSAMMTMAQSTPRLTASVARETPLNPTLAAQVAIPEEKSFAQKSGDRLSQLLAEEASKNKGMIKPKVEIIGEVCESCSA